MLHINKPWFGAGKKYHWPGPPIGFGIRVGLLTNRIVEVTIGDSDEVWVGHSRAIKDFLEEFKSFQVRKGVRLAIVPWYLFDKKTKHPTLWPN